jgi:hypothetical protein
MKNLFLFEEYIRNNKISGEAHHVSYDPIDNESLYEVVNSIMGGELTESEVQDLLDEGLFSWLGSLFSNPKKKRELDKLAQKLVEVRVDIAKVNIEAENIEAFEEELNAKEDMYANTLPAKAIKSNKTSMTDLKGAQLKELESDVIMRMDVIGEENDKLKTYVNKVKLDSRIQSTEKIMRMADGQIKKVLSKMAMQDKKKDRELTKELKVQMN